MYSVYAFTTDTALQLLNGLVIDMADSDATKFGFMEEGGRTLHFKATSSQVRAAWVANIQSILASQTQMRKGMLPVCVCAPPLTPPPLKLWCLADGCLPTWRECRPWH